MSEVDFSKCRVCGGEGYYHESVDCIEHLKGRIAALEVEKDALRAQVEALRGFDSKDAGRRELWFYDGETAKRRPRLSAQGDNE